jgi:hypothetical protein
MQTQSGRSAPDVRGDRTKTVQISATDAKILGNYLALIERASGLKDEAAEISAGAEESIRGYWVRLYAAFQKNPKSLQGLQDWIGKRPKADIPRLASSLARVEAPKGTKALAVHTKDGKAVIEHAASAKVPNISQAHRKIMRGAAEIITGLAALRTHDGTDHKEFVVDCKVGLMLANVIESIEKGQITPVLDKVSSDKKGIHLLSE